MITYVGLGLIVLFAFLALYSAWRAVKSTREVNALLTRLNQAANARAQDSVSGPHVVQKCDTCALFNLSEGQRILRTTAFGQAASFLAPYQMSANARQPTDPPTNRLQSMPAPTKTSEDDQADQDDEVVVDEDTEDTEESVSKDLWACQWVDLGACGQHQELRFRNDKCDEWSAIT